MSTPTRQDIINAHNALEKLNHMAWNGSEDMYDKRLCALWKKQILAALPPIPQPTMAEVEWDDDKHYLAEAEHPIWGRSIMIFQNVDTGNIFIEFRENGERNLVYTPPKSLTPTGRRCTLTEVQDD